MFVCVTVRAILISLSCMKARKGLSKLPARAFAQGCGQLSDCWCLYDFASCRYPSLAAASRAVGHCRVAIGLALPPCLALTVGQPDSAPEEHQKCSDALHFSVPRGACPHDLKVTSQLQVSLLQQPQHDQQSLKPHSRGKLWFHLQLSAQR